MDSAVRTAIAASIMLIKLMMAEPFDLSCMCAIAKLDALLKISDVPK